MSRVLALTLPLAAGARIDALEVARRMLVLGCAAALILAGRVHPF